MTQRIACIDMEGVLIPELWPHLAEATGIEELSVTTREVPDYPRLVDRRIGTLRHHGLKLADVQALLDDIEPLPGAEAFLARLAQGFRVSLVSDAFEEMVLPLWRRLGQPQLLCHRLVCDDEGFVQAARYTRTRGKHEVIEALSAEGAWTLAVGDAFNDLSMLRMASKGLLFRPSTQTALAAPDIGIAESYDEVLAAVE